MYTRGTRNCVVVCDAGSIASVLFFPAQIIMIPASVSARISGRMWLMLRRPPNSPLRGSFGVFESPTSSLMGQPTSLYTFVSFLQDGVLLPISLALCSQLCRGFTVHLVLT